MPRPGDNRGKKPLLHQTNLKSFTERWATPLARKANTSLPVQQPLNQTERTMECPLFGRAQL